MRYRTLAPKGRSLVVEPLEFRIVLSAITSGQTVSGNIETIASQDTYTFSAKAGDRVILQAGSVDGSDLRHLRLELSGPNGFHDSDQNLDKAVLDLVIPNSSSYTGTYTVVARSYSSETGTYKLSLADVPGTQSSDAQGDGGVIKSDQLRSGTINDISDLDIFTFAATAGNHIVVQLGRHTDSDLRHLRVELSGPNGFRDSDQNLDKAVLNFFVPNSASYTGAYFVVVRSYSDETGAYDLSLTGATGPTPPPSDDPNDQISEAKSIAIGSTASGTIDSAADVDMYKISVGAGQTFSFDIDRPTGSLDSLIRLFSYNATSKTASLLTVNDNAAAPGETKGKDSYLSYKFAKAGTYYLGVSGSPNFDYGPVSGKDGKAGLTTGAFKLQVLRRLAWGAKVSAEFRTKVLKIASNLQTDADFLMAVMAFETGESFSPSQKSQAGNAVGLIQFTKIGVSGLGVTLEQLAKMTAVKQLDFVEKFLLPKKGKIAKLADLYMAVLFPVAVGKPGTYTLFTKPSANYTANSGLDKNKDGKVLKDEAASFVQAKLTKGLGTGFIG